MGVFYFLLGVVLLVPLLWKVGWLLWIVETFKVHPIFEWCLGWSSIGISAGLINTRFAKPSCWLLHYVGYWGFVLVVVSLTSLVVGLYASGEPLDSPGDKFYWLAALVGLVGGFAGHQLYELIFKVVERK